MIDCTHKFGLKAKDDGGFYCPVCRKTFVGEFIDEDTGQRRVESSRFDGLRWDDSEKLIGVIRKI